MAEGKRGQSTDRKAHSAPKIKVSMFIVTFFQLFEWEPQTDRDEQRSHPLNQIHNLTDVSLSIQKMN